MFFLAVNVREMLEVAGFFENIEKDRLYLSIHDAVLSSLEKNPDILEQVLCVGEGDGDVFVFVSYKIYLFDHCLCVCQILFI